MRAPVTAERDKKDGVVMLDLRGLGFANPAFKSRMGMTTSEAWEVDDEYGIGHRLRHGNPEPGDLMEAAQIIDAYGYLIVEANRAKREMVVRDMRVLLRATPDLPTTERQS